MQIETIIKEVIHGELGKPTFIMRPMLDKYTAIITFPVLKDGVSFRTLTTQITEKKWNAFWSQFNDGRHLIEKLQEKYDLSTLVIPDDIEDWFVNMV